MFKGFNEKSFEFLWGIRFNNNREWFNENKQVYIDNVQKPIGELAQEVWKYMADKHVPEINYHVSKIYKDARYSHSDAIYRDRLWFSLRRQNENWTETPVFFFEIIPEGCTYGMGYYSAKPSTMQKFRNKIDEAPKDFESIIGELDMENAFAQYGDKYKRSKGNNPPHIAEWYDLKNIGLIANIPIGEEVYSELLIKIICDGFEKLLPLYNYLWSLEKEA